MNTAKQLADPAPRWLRRLRLSHLQLLVELSRQKSLTSVGEALHMTQPAVSQHLADLEAALGAKLFVRRRGLQRTPFGDAALRWAAHTLATAQRLDQELAALHAGATGLVRIGLMLVAAIEFVPEAIDQLARQDAGLQISLHEDIMQGLWTRLNAGELDLVVGRIDERVRASHFAYEVLYEDHHCVAVRRGHPLLKKRRIGWSDTLRYPWVLPPDSTVLRQALTTTFVSKALAPPKPWVESSSLTATQAILRSSDCIGVISGTAGRRGKADGILDRLPLELSGPELPVGVIVREAHPPAAQLRVLEALRSVAARGVT